MALNSVVRSAFRRMADAEEFMIRSSMPRTAVVSVAPLEGPCRCLRVTVANNGSSRLVRPVVTLTASVAERMEVRNA